MPPFALRPATQNDSRAIRALIRAVRINPFGLDWRNFILATNPAEGIIGCGQVKQRRDGAHLLASIAVTPEWRDRGVGSAIIENLLSTYNEPLYLTCRASLKGYYQRFGFQVLLEPEMPPYFSKVFKAVNIFIRLRIIKEPILVMGNMEN